MRIGMNKVFALFVIAIAMLFFISCSESRYAVYESSEPNGPLIVFDKQNGEYWHSDKTVFFNFVTKPKISKPDDDGNISNLSAYRENDYYYINGINAILPLGGPNKILSNFKSICETSNKLKNVEITLICIKKNRKYKFSFSMKRGITRVRMGCIFRFGEECIYLLKSDIGLFANGYIPEKIREFDGPQ
jgi:hypothetical protein